jgi:hypothetical protein
MDHRRLKQLQKDGKNKETFLLLRKRCKTKSQATDKDFPRRRA